MNNNIKRIYIDKSYKNRERLVEHLSASEKEAEETIWWNSLSRPLGVLSDQVWEKLEILDISLISYKHALYLKSLKADKFPNLQKFTISCCSISNDDFSLSLPNLKFLELCCRVTPKQLRQVLTNTTNMPSLFSLALIDLQCADWSSFADINHKNLKSFKFESDIIQDQAFVLHYLRIGIAKSLQNLEELYFGVYWVPHNYSIVPKLFPIGMDFQKIKRLAFKTNMYHVEDFYDFIALSRAVPNVEELDLSDVIDGDDDDLEYQEYLEGYVERAKKPVRLFFEKLAEENARHPCFPNLKYIRFSSNWKSHKLLCGDRSTPPEILLLVCETAREIWPNAVVSCGRYTLTLRNKLYHTVRDWTPHTFKVSWYS